MRNLYISIFAIALFITSTSVANAAILFLDAETNSVGINQEFYIDVKIDTEGSQINAIQAKVNFPISSFEVLEIDRKGSTFNFWVEEPSFSNDDGVISFVGGSASGRSGESLQVLRIVLKATGSAGGTLTPANAVITASDGKGTNVLSTISGVTISTGTNVVIPKIIEEPKFDPTKVIVEAPVQIVRKAVEATGLPERPKLTVPLYPESDKWYSHSGAVTVLWDVPLDVTKVAVAVDENPNTEPPKAEDALYTGKSVGVFGEGIGYIHVQFRNNVGWGKVAHYRIAIDQTAPIPFKAESSIAISDNPTPQISFDTQDALSGISHALIVIDNINQVRATSSPATLPPQKPGKHSATVRVFDKAGNSVESSVEFEILPLPKPTVTFSTRTISQGEPLFISGNASRDLFIDIRAIDKRGTTAFSESASSDSAGNWEFVSEEILPTGKYTFVANARDDRGAISYDTDAISFKVRAKTIISFGFVDIGWFELLLILVLLVAAASGVGGRYLMLEQEKKLAYSIIAARDIEKLTKLLAKDLTDLEKWISKQKITPRAKEEIVHLFNKMASNILKMKKYLSEELKKTK